MGIIDRLSTVIRSYLNEDSSVQSDSGWARNTGRTSDPDLDAAFEELNDFLGKEKRGADGESRDQSRHTDNSRRTGRQGDASAIPETLRADFAELGVPFGADAEVCKTAYKKLLKIHHPDRHAGHAENMRKATEKSSRINAAYERIERWRAGGAL